MHSRFGQAQETPPAQVTPQAIVQNGAQPTAKEIPYDYVATFTLRGDQRGNRVQQVINISVDGAFVAVAIAYSFIPKALPALSAIAFDTPQPHTATLVELIARGTAQKFVTVLNLPTKKEVEDQLTTVIQPIMDPHVLQCLMVRLCGIDFKYSIVDSGTGRELQNLAIHNIAGLGESSGERPFRPLAKPVLFMPRSTIRIEVEEISVGPIYTGAELFIVLHGYKMLGYGTGLP